MAIETLKIPAHGSADISGLNRHTQKTTKSSTLDDLSSPKKSEEKKTNEKKEKDRLSLSQRAQQLLEDKRNPVLTNDKEVKTESADSHKITQDAITLRGLQQLAQRVPLNESQQQQLKDVRKSLADNNISDTQAIRIADKALQQAQNQAPSLVQNLNDNNITGNQFAQLNQINATLNKANGFGVDNTEQPPAQQTQVEDITNKFNDIVAQTKDQKLSKDTIDNLDQLQKQLSQVQGFQLNVKDTVGPGGLVL